MPEKVRVVTLGCEKNGVDSEIMPGQRCKSEWMEEMPEIDGIAGTGDFHKINEIIDEALHGRKPVYVDNPVFIYEEYTAGCCGETRRVRITHAYEYDLSGEGIA